MKNVAKYSAVFKTKLKGVLHYRGELILWSFIDGLPLISNLILWSVAFLNTDTISGLTRSAVISYYIIGYLFQDISGSHFEEHYIKEVLSGNINALLLKPVSVKKLMVVEEIAWRMFGMLFSVTPVIIIGFIMGVDIFRPIPLNQFVILALVVMLSFFMETIYSLAIIAMSFIMEEARSLMHLKWMIQWLLSGSMIPFEFMPDWLSKIAQILPFQARYYLPTNIYLQTIDPSQLKHKLILMIIWAIVLYGAIKWLWQKNLRKFTAVGS